MTTAAPHLFNFQDKGVLVAVGADGLDFLELTGSGAFVPKGLATTGVVDRLLLLQSLEQGLMVHVSQHEWFFGVGINRHGRDEPVGVELGHEGETVLNGILVGLFGEHVIGELGFGFGGGRDLRESQGVQSSFDFGVDFIFNSLGGHVERIANGKGSRGAVGNDDRATYSEQRRAAIGLVVGAFFDIAEGTFGKKGPDHSEGVALELFFQPLGHRLGRRFARLEDDVAGKAIAEADIEFGFKKIVSLNVTAKVEVGVSRFDHVPQKDERLLGQRGSFFFLFPVGHDANYWPLNREYLGGVDCTHHCVGGEVFGLGFGIGSRVENVAGAELIGNGRSNARSVHAFEEAELDGGSRNRRARIAGGDHGLRRSLFDEVGGNRDGAVLFAADRLGARFVHLDDLASVLNSGFGRGQVVTGATLPQECLVTDQNDALDLRVEPQRVASPDYVDIGSLVPAHGVECDNHFR